MTVQNSNVDICLYVMESMAMAQKNNIILDYSLSPKKVVFGLFCRADLYGSNEVTDSDLVVRLDFFLPSKAHLY